MPSGSTTDVKWDPVGGTKYLDTPSGVSVLGVLCFIIGVIIVLDDRKDAGRGIFLVVGGLLMAVPLFVRGILRLAVAIGLRHATREKRARLGVALILIGVGLFFYGILGSRGYSSPGRVRSFLPSLRAPYGIAKGKPFGWSTEARLEAAVGAVLAAGGLLLYRAKN